MFKIKTKISLAEKVRGFFSFGFAYEIRVPMGDWSPFFGKYQNQKWGYWDSNSCYALAMINCLEDQLEWLWKNGQFSDEAKKFFNQNGYIDSDGDFSLSERYIEILSGNLNNGGSSSEAWKLAMTYGCIPRPLLAYTVERADRFYNTRDFVTDYFNTAEITQGMRDMGKEFLTHVIMARQQIGAAWQTPDRTLLQAALKQAPLQLGVPIPTNVSAWNNPVVQWDGGTTPAHSVELYAINDKGQYLIFDQYEPHLKVLSADYYLPFVTQGLVKAAPQKQANPINQTGLGAQMWRAAYEYYQLIEKKVRVFQ